MSPGVPLFSQAVIKQRWAQGFTESLSSPLSPYLPLPCHSGHPQLSAAVSFSVPDTRSGWQPTKVVHQAWGSLTAAGELQRCAFASRLSVPPGSHPAHNPVSTMPGNKERALVSHEIAAMQSLYALEKSICPTFVCGCPLLKTYYLIPVPFTTSRYFDPQQYLSVKGYFMWGTHTCQRLSEHTMC